VTTVGSLCSGAAALESIFHAEPVWHAEDDDDMSTLLGKHFPDVPNMGSIRPLVIDWGRQARPDIVTAGFPCQPISGAGRQRHREDERYLWPDVARIIHVTGPRAVFLENVQRITSIDGGSVLTEILTDLRLMGYAARWTVLGACAVGLAHHRHRWFCWAEWVGDNAPPAQHVKVPCGAPRTGGRRLLPTPLARDGNTCGEGGVAYWERKRAAGWDKGMPLGAVVRLFPTPRATDGPNGGPNQRGRKGDLALPSAVLGERFGEYALAVEQHAAVTGVLPPEPTEPNSNGEPRLSPAFAEWLMDLPAGWVTDYFGRVPALRGIGNGVVPRQARAAWELLAR
jgi:DNA (cytosine-5)-methyltransferase 1